MKSEFGRLDPQTEFPSSPEEQRAILELLPEELKVEAARLIRILGAHGYTVRLSADGTLYGQFDSDGQLVATDPLKWP